jgi:tetratricopeptide (TPR) repeat protein
MADIRNKLITESTPRLIQIWQQNDGRDYSDEAFAVIRQLLEGRGVLPSPQIPKLPEVELRGWFAPKCPVTGADKDWIERSMLWLIGEFGHDFLAQVRVILPTPEDFPDPFSGCKEDAQNLLNRVCDYMGVNPQRLQLEIYSESHDDLRAILPEGMTREWSHSGTAGHYRKHKGKVLIGIEAAQLNNPMALVATIAHELGHELLLGERRITQDREDHEPLTDLLTVFFGMGVFTANSVFNFSQWTGGGRQGWSARGQGYLTERMFGYALALFAWLRGESKPEWADYLEGDSREFYKQGAKYLEKTGDCLLSRNVSPEKYAAAFVTLGHAYSSEGYWSDAVMAYGKSLDLNAHNATAWLARGVAHYNMRALDEAIADFNQTLALTADPAEAYRRRALAWYDRGEWDEAIADYNRALELNPSDALTMTLRGAARNDSGDLHGALADYTAAVEINPSNPFALVSRGSALLQQGQADQAMADFNRALELDPGYSFAYLNRGQALAQRGILDEAITDYDQAVEIDPYDPRCYSIRGWALLDKAEFDRASADFSRAIEIAPDCVEAYLGRGAALLGKGIHKKVIADLDRAVEPSPENADALYDRDCSCDDDGDLKKAIADYNKALKLNPDLADAWNNRGYAKYQKGYLDGARIDFDRAIALDPEMTLAYVNRGIVHLRQRNQTQAQADFDKCLELDDSMKSHIEERIRKET